MDLIYGDISDKNINGQLVPGLVILEKGGLEIWVVTPNIGYMPVDDERQRFEVYADAIFLVRS